MCMCTYQHACACLWNRTHEIEILHGTPPCLNWTLVKFPLYSILQHACTCTYMYKCTCVSSNEMILCRVLYILQCQEFHWWSFRLASAWLLGVDISPPGNLCRRHCTRGVFILLSSVCVTICGVFFDYTIIFIRHTVLHANLLQFMILFPGKFCILWRTAVVSLDEDSAGECLLGGGPFEFSFPMEVAICFLWYCDKDSPLDNILIAFSDIFLFVCSVNFLVLCELSCPVFLCKLILFSSFAA